MKRRCSCRSSYCLTSEDQNTDPFDIWKHDPWPQPKKLLCFTKQSTKHIARNNHLIANHVIADYFTLFNLHTAETKLWSIFSLVYFFCSIIYMHQFINWPALMSKSQLHWNKMNQHIHIDTWKTQNWGCVMSPFHPGQLNTSHYGLASLKRLINPSDQPPVTIRKTSRHIGQSLHGQRRSTPTQVTGNWIATENLVCLSTWKIFVYSQLVTRPGRLYGLKKKKQRWCLM